MRALIIANPISGRGRGGRMAKALEQALRGHGVTTALEVTSARGAAREAAAQGAQGVDVVVSVGGDGTLSEVINGLPLEGPPLGLLPAGTANVLARELNLPGDVAGCARVLMAGRTRPLDLMQVNGRRSFLMVSTGIEAAVVEDLERRRAGSPISKLSYLVPILRALRSYRIPRLQISVDGAAPLLCGQCIASNVRQLGTRLLRFDHRPILDDGRIETYLCRGTTKRATLRYATRMFFARLAAAADVDFFRARRLRIESDYPVPYQVDGDHAGMTPIDLEVIAQPLRILTPAER